MNPLPTYGKEPRHGMTIPSNGEALAETGGETFYSNQRNSVSMTNHLIQYTLELISVYLELVRQS